MPKRPADSGKPEEAKPSFPEDGTLYALAGEAMKVYIRAYLRLATVTHGFADIRTGHITGKDDKLLLLAGFNSPLDPDRTSPAEVVAEWQRVRALPFDIEQAITAGVYIQLRAKVAQLLTALEAETKGFMKFDPSFIFKNAYMLPVLQRLANLSSKAELKRQIGSVSDNAVSLPAARRLAELLNQRAPGRAVTRGQLLQSIEPTLEGIVRDLVGRVLLESVVSDALDAAGVPYKRESEYRYIEGVVYNFRADFVIPNDIAPRAFVEVRKSSTRHASLYAKDKMFSAINWKGKNRQLLAVLVVEGPWTAETLKVMAKVFDYVVPLKTVAEVARIISDYVRGDASKLKWLIDFSIHPVRESR